MDFIRLFAVNIHSQTIKLMIRRYYKNRNKLEIIGLISPLHPYLKMNHNLVHIYWFLSHCNTLFSFMNAVTTN